MSSVASSAVLGLVAVPPMAAHATSNKERHVDRAVCQRGAAPRGDEALQRHCFGEEATIAPSTNDEVFLRKKQP